MNSTINTQLNHRSIRKFTDQPVPAELTASLLAVVNQTATSTGAQSFSLIHITDPRKKETIAAVCKQSYVASIPELYIFIVDAYRNAMIAKEQGCTLAAARDMDRFFQGFTDGCLAAQNMTAAIESLGLGALYLGSILNNVDEIISILGLPELTFPIVGVGFGYPAESPMLKPRMSLDLKVFENHYQKQDNYLEAIKDYDQVMQNYYDLRDTTKSLPAFSRQIVQRLENANPMRATLLRSVKKQGFDLNLLS